MHGPTDDKSITVSCNEKKVKSDVIKIRTKNDLQAARSQLIS